MKKTEYIKVGSRYKKITYIDLRHNKDSFAIEYVKQQIEKFRKFVSLIFSNFSIVFLEIPCYSIEHYNKHLRCPNPESFHENDLTLTKRIGILNDHIRDVKVNLDLIHQGLRRTSLSTEKVNVTNRGQV